MIKPLSGIFNHPLRYIYQRDTSAAKPHNRVFVSWGIFIMSFYVLSWITPLNYLGYPRLFYLLNMFVWLYIGFKKNYISLRAGFPVAISAILQFWIVFCTLYSAYVIGRHLELGRAFYFMVEHTIPFFITYGLVSIDRSIAIVFRRIVLTVFFISVFIGLLQFLRVPFAIAISRLYTYKDIDFWDGTSGVRAVGLTWHPNALAFQCTIAAGLVYSKYFYAKLKAVDYAMLLMFCFMSFATQARVAIPVLAIFVIFIVIHQAKVNKKSILYSAVILSLLSFVILSFGQKRLGYTFQTKSLQTDSSYNFRQTYSWAQLDAIYPTFPITGVGPSVGLFIGPDFPESKWIPQGTIMESAYRVFLAMFGIPGLSILIFGLLFSLILSIYSCVNKARSPDLRAWSFTAAFVVIHLIFNCYSVNTFDQLMPITSAYMIAGTIYALLHLDRRDESADRPLMP